MSKNKIIRNTICILIVFLLIFSPLSFSFSSLRLPVVLGMDRIEIAEDTVWEKGEHIINNWVVVTNGATLTIEKGAVIKFEKGDVYTYSPSLSVSDGNIIAKGTQEEKIVFTTKSGDNSYETGEYGMSFQGNQDNKESFFRYVVFENGGYAPQLMLKNTFLNTALAGTGMSGFDFSSGKVHIENSEFINNPYGAISAYSSSANDYLEIINSNFENNGGMAMRADEAYCKEYEYDEELEEDICTKYNILLKNNWYGDVSGPHVYADNGEILNDGSGEEIAGHLTFDGFRKNDLIADPAIIIPGILGSTKVLGKWKLDPILHTYSNLASSFEKNGYEKEKNLFEFPYEWRNENSITAGDLKNKIQEIREETKISRVDLVAHSMGGLVARQYIEKLDQENNIDQLITLGTPQKGAPESYLMWEAGEGIDEDILNKIAKKIFQIEAQHEGYDDLGEYIREKVLSVGELLPIYDYLYNVATGEMKNYSNGYPKNYFLETLNDGDNLDKLDKVDFTNIIGDTGKDETIKKFRVVNSMVSGSWEYGMPENFDDSSTDQGMEYGKGDETVPLESAEGISADKTIKLDSTHNDLPTKAQCYAIKKLTGRDDCDYVSTFDRIKNILTFGIFSPIDIQIISPNGKWAGKNINNLDAGDQIEDAYYTGYDTENEFLTIPNPEDGEYKIITEGTGDGEYRIEMAKITEDENGTASEITGEINGTAENGVQTEKIVEVSQDEIDTGEEENQDTVPPTIDITSPENKTYLSDKVVPIEFVITDDSSGVNEEKTKIFLDGEMFSQDKIDLAYLEKGEHILKISAEDKAGNKKEENITFSISPTIDSIIKNVEHYYQDKFITKKATYNFLEAKLKVIKIQKMLYDAINFSPWPARLKNQLLKNIARNINRDIDVL
ncbi:MAG: alpha/beta fold hydrolase, partial [Candidatus Moraniibacteriota bacterium]